MMRIPPDPAPDPDPQHCRKHWYLWRQENSFIYLFWPISMLRDPDPQSQYGSGSRTPK
jgi:hypothetical protein